MKISELLAKINKSDKNSNWVHLDEISNELGLNLYITEKNTELKSYWLWKKYDTDSYVGLEAFFLKDEFVLLTMQNGRKSDTNYEWASKELKNKVINYIISLEDTTEDEDNSEYVDFDEELGNGVSVSYSSQLLTNNVIYKKTGEMVNITDSWANEKDCKKWSLVEITFESGDTKIVKLDNDITIPFCLQEDG